MAIITIQGQAERQMGIHYTVDTDLPPLGVGGMGQVFKGYRVDERTGVQQEAAIKFLFDDLPLSAIERSRREASIMIQSENLVEMFGFIEVDETDAMGNIVARHYHVASELLDGVALDDLLKGKVTNANGEPFVFAQDLYRRFQNDRVAFAIKIIKSVLSGIMALHDKGYIHRDIDPSNIMITKNGKIKLIDFGIARQIDNLEQTQRRQLTTAGQFMGKASYAAPELVVGDVASQNETTDIYAIGIMLFELIAGHLPFDGPIHEVLDMQLRSPLPLAEIQNPWVRDIIAKATAKRQSDRYASAAEFRVALEQLSRNSNPGRNRPRQAQPMPQQPMPQQPMPQQPMPQQPMPQQPMPQQPMPQQPMPQQPMPQQPMPQQPVPQQPMPPLPGDPPAMPKRQPVKPSPKKPSNNDDRQKILKIAGAAVGVLLLVLIGLYVIGSKSGDTPPSGGGDTPQVETAQVDAPTPSEPQPAQPSTPSGETVDGALSMLADPSQAKDGIALLERLGNQDGPQAALALYELSQLYCQPKTYKHDKQAMENAKKLIPKKDYKKAHELNEKALQKDPNCYPAMFEIANDYMAGEARGVVERDTDKARELFSKSMQLAEEADDDFIIGQIDLRLSQL